uniref:AcidPPc domain-containing protein n=1 Tax=Ascaris lumbricoides TaxID=6252 RepID=A0A0M3IPF7_ASCLU
MSLLVMQIWGREGASNLRKHLRQPGVGPGSAPWEGAMIPLHHWRALVAQVQLWLWDHDLSASLVIESALDARSDIRQVFRWLELALHGIPWIVASSGLCVDVVCVGIIKVFVRRPRPVYDKQDQVNVYEAPIADKFSFPSGHSSRSAMLAVLA